ncbi:MAG TPA: DNA recombination protein RmuC [Phycisphaerae bacterium]|nr:DNA recombination protein RmuC [Phycisphaerae bacterium]
MNAVAAVIIGVVVGAVVVGLVWLLWRRREQDLTRQLIEQAQAEKAHELQSIIDQVKTNFAALSREALSANTEDFLKLAGTKLADHTKQGEAALESRKKLIDKTVEQMTTRLGELGTALQTLDKDRRQSHGSLTKQLDATTQATGELQKTTAQLREALANPQRRGQWGERMAEDVLRLAGFIEGVNYRKQSVTATGSKPDYTFLLPQGRCVNMDVKFPLPNYLKYLDAPDDGPARDQARTAFLRDVRSRIKEVTTRDYIDPDAGTVEYVLVFIPNEQVYSFIHQHDPSLLDDALKARVVLCSPLTLYAVLAVIRQAAENFRLEQTSREILVLLGAFRKEWAKYTDVMDKMGKRLDEAMKQYELLSTTRTRQLERQLDRIDNLRSAQSPSMLPDNVTDTGERPCG